MTFDITWHLTFLDIWHFMTFDISWHLGGNSRKIMQNLDFNQTVKSVVFVHQMHGIQVKGLQSQFSIHFGICWNGVSLPAEHPSKVLHLCYVSKHIRALSALTSSVHVPSTEDCSSSIESPIESGASNISHIEVLPVLPDIGQTYQRLVTWLTFSI